MKQYIKEKEVYTILKEEILYIERNLDFLGWETLDELFEKGTQEEIEAVLPDEISKLCDLSKEGEKEFVSELLKKYYETLN